LLDWAKAFDTTPHAAKALERIGLPEPMPHVIMDLYANPTFKVKEGPITSDSKPQYRGVMQGCPLRPYIFIIALTVLMQDVEDKYVQQYGSVPWAFSAASPLWDMEHANDTVLIARSAEAFRKLLHILEWEAEQVGLHLNKPKCEHLQCKSEHRIHFRSGTNEQCKCPVCATQPPISPGPLVPISSLVKYLGVHLSPKGDASPGFRKRLSQAYAASKILKPFFGHASIPDTWKFNVYKQVLQAIILHASESDTPKVI
jgi:hypothetical protein